MDWVSQKNKKNSLPLSNPLTLDAYRISQQAKTSFAMILERGQIVMLVLAQTLVWHVE